MGDELEATLRELVGAEVTGLRRLSGGASRETWSFDAGGRPLILQRRRAGAGVSAVTMTTEVAALRAAFEAGVPVPDVVVDATDGVVLGAPAFVVERLEGETIARRLLRDLEYAGVRPVVAGECGSILAAIHRIPVDTIEGLTTSDPLESMRNTLDSLGEPHPAFELGLRWLAQNRPPAGRTAVVHGDFRTGNLMIDAKRVVAVLDWELVHLGDPMEDLGWFCVRAWRFGADARPAGGFGSREELWAAYEASGGDPVDPEVARWWEVFGTLRWGVICIVQAASHLLGLARSMELAAIGRRSCENEHDLLSLLAPDVPTPAPTRGETSGAHPPHDRPSAVELVEAVREWLATDVAAGTEGRLRFHSRVATNVMGMLERELRLGPVHAVAHTERLARLGFADDAALAAAIRSGAVDDRWDELVPEVWASVVDKLEVSNPGYTDFRP